MTLHSLHRRVHQSAQQGAEVFALTGALRHEHGEQLFLWIDPEERSGDPAPEALADRTREWRHARLGSDRKTQTEAVAFALPDARICAGCVIREVSTAIGKTPVRSKPSASSSFRLYSESPRARSTRPARVASSSRPSAARRKSAGSYGAKYEAGVTLWYCRTRPDGSDANASVIGDGSA